MGLMTGGLSGVVRLPGLWRCAVRWLASPNTVHFEPAHLILGLVGAVMCRGSPLLRSGKFDILRLTPLGLVLPRL